MRTNRGDFSDPSIIPSCVLPSQNNDKYTCTHTCKYHEVIDWNYPANNVSIRLELAEIGKQIIIVKNKMYGASLVAQW